MFCAELANGVTIHKFDYKNCVVIIKPWYNFGRNGKTTIDMLYIENGRPNREIIRIGR